MALPCKLFDTGTILGGCISLCQPLTEKWPSVLTNHSLDVTTQRQENAPPAVAHTMRARSDTLRKNKNTP